MGGKTGTTTQQSSVSIPPEVLARYNSVNARAESLADQPFTPYSGEFVAPLTGTQQAGISNINQAQGMATPYYDAAGNAMTGSYQSAQPYYGAATSSMMGGQQNANALQGEAYQGINQAYYGAQPYQQAATYGVGQAYAGAQPYQELAGQNINQAYYGAQPYQQAATYGVGQAYAGAQPYQESAGQNINQAYAGAQPYQQAATYGVGQAYAGAQPYQEAAGQNINQAYYGAQPYQQAATSGLGQAYAGAQPYQGIATGLGLASANAVNPDALDGQSINQYMSPYLNSVVGSTMANLRQQQQQEQSQILGNQIMSGAFGGDRGRIAQANLARQQEMATGQTVAGLMNQGYGQALQTAQQQQGQQLSAEQANRAARAGAAQQLAAIGQQGFGQGVTTAQQLAAIGQQGFGQGMTTAQQQAALGQQGFGQGVTTAQQLAAIGQQGFGQGMTTAQQQAALGQQGFGQGMTTAQQLAAIGQQGFGQGMTTAQQQAALGQQGFGQGMTTAQQLAAIGQQGFGQGMTAAQQQAALGQQAFAQGAQGAQTYQGLGQGLYGMGQEYGKNVAGLGTQAQESALKGAQAQLAAGTLEQQTQQAQNTADYNQFLQQQGYPFQIAQFLANIAMGTGALSGSSQTGTTTSPQSFFSDRRLKDDIEKIGKTFDGQDIVRYKYKGEPGTRIGLIAQDVEKHHPEAVGLAGGYRTVDYDKATDKAADRGHFASGGLAGGYSSEGGAVLPEMSGMGFAQGGAPDISSMMAEILNSHQGMYPYGKAGLYGQSGGRAGAYGTSQMQTPTRGLMRVDPSAFVRPAEQPGAGGQAMQGLNAVERAGSAYTSGSNALFGSDPTAANPQGGRGLIGRGGQYNPSEGGPANFVRRQTQSSEPTLTAEVSASMPNEITSLNDANLGSNASVLSGLAESGQATGGLVRGHYAMGGLPFSEAGGYIPDAVLNDNEAEKNKKAMDSFTPKPAGAGQSGSGSGSGSGLMGTLGQIGGAIKGAEALGSAASSIGAATGATEAISAALPMIMSFFSDRRLKDDIEKIGKTFDGQDIVRYRYKGEPATQIGLIAQDVEKHHPGAVGLAGGYRTVDYHKATEDAADRGHFAGGGLASMRHGYAFDGEVSANQEGMAGLAGLEGGLGRANDNGLEVERIVNSLGAVESGRRGNYNAIGTAVPRPGRAPDYAHGRYQVMGENIGPWTEAALGQRLSPQEFLANQTAQEDVVRHRVQQDLNRYGNARDVASTWFSGVPVSQSANRRDVNIGVPEYLRRFDEAYGSYSPGAGLGAPAVSEAAATQRAPGNNAGLGAVSPNQNLSDGSGSSDAASQSGVDQTTNRAAERRQRAGVNFNYPRERGEPNWMQRNQDWLVPLLSGVGAMASSPSRYLGSALLQGVAGGAQQYASMQNKAEEQQVQRGQLEVSQEQARTAATREETASQVAGQQVMDAFDRRYRQIVRPDGTIAFIDQTGGGTLTAEQHAQQRATLFNALLTGNRGVRALSAGQARPGTTEGAVTAALAGNASPRPAPAGNAAPGATLTDENISRVSPTGVTTSGGAPAAGANAPPAATGTPDVSAAPPANPQEAAALAEANRFLEPVVADLNRTLHEIEVAGNNYGMNKIPADLITTRDRLRNELREYRTGKTPIPNPNGGPENDFFVQRQIARDAQRAREEALARAEAENEFAPYIDLATGTLVQPTRRRAPPSGSSAPAPQGAAQQPAAAPPPAANEQRPATATVAPSTAAVTTALPTPPPGGGSPIPQNLPPGTQIREISRPAQQAIERDADMNSYLTSGPVMDEAIKRYHSMARALQLFQSGRTSEMTGFVAAYAADLGMPDIANAINRGQVDAQQWLGKEGLNAALQQLAAINSRFTQAEFSRVQSSGMPSITNTPQANYQMLTNGLSSLYRLRQFQTDWQAAQQQGWNSPSAFYDAWSRANPSEAFSTAAERRVGNIRGMQLPQDAQRNWVPGQTYVMPDNAPPAVQRAFANVRPGQVFRFNGLDSETPYTVLNRAQAYSTGTQ